MILEIQIVTEDNTTQLLKVDAQKAIDAKQWAINNGFDRIRTSNIDLNIKPNFINTVKI